MLYLVAALATVASAEKFTMKFHSGLYEDDQCKDVVEAPECADHVTCEDLKTILGDAGFDVSKDFACEEDECYIKLHVDAKGKELFATCVQLGQEFSSDGCELDTEDNTGSGSGSGGPMYYIDTKIKCEAKDESSAAALSIAASVFVGLLALF